MMIGPSPDLGSVSGEISWVIEMAVGRSTILVQRNLEAGWILEHLMIIYEPYGRP